MLSGLFFAKGTISFFNHEFSVPRWATRQFDEVAYFATAMPDHAMTNVVAGTAFLVLVVGFVFFNWKFVKSVVVFVKIFLDLKKSKQVTAVEIQPGYDNETWKATFSPPQSGKILWAFWDKGELRLMAKDCFASWSVRNPDWKICLVSLDNYREYVPRAILPATFESLKPQHQSDTIRVALLLQYGGIYMDVSTAVYRSFNAFWEELDDKSMALNTLFRFADTDIEFYNNSFVAVKKPGHPVLQEWQRRMNEYLLQPCQTRTEVLNHPYFARLKPIVLKRGIGILDDMVPYMALLWIFNDMLIFNPEYQKLVIILPCHSFGLANFQVDNRVKQFKSKGCEPTVVPDLLVEHCDWSRMGVLKSALGPLLSCWLHDDTELAEYMIAQSTLLKFTSEFFALSKHFDTDQARCTLAQVIRAGSNISSYPSTPQASLQGSRQAKHSPEKYIDT